MSINLDDYATVVFDNHYEGSEFQQFLFRYGFGWGVDSVSTVLIQVRKLVICFSTKTIFHYDSGYKSITEYQAFAASYLVKNRCVPAFNCETFFKKLEKSS